MLGSEMTQQDFWNSLALRADYLLLASPEDDDEVEPDEDDDDSDDDDFDDDIETDE